MDHQDNDPAQPMLQFQEELLAALAKERITEKMEIELS
jgi:ssRNA-specific RNase YbeY (16S rRNA maturation enzyme)